MCADCRREDNEIRTILEGADALHDDVRGAMAGIDWDGFADRIAEAAFSGRRRPADAPSRLRRFWAALFAPRWRPVLAGATAGIFLGAVGMYIALKPGIPERFRAAAGPGSIEFMDRVEVSLAKRETIDYLGKSRALLLDFVQASPETAAQSLRNGDASRRARDLLAKKRYLNSGLESDRMAKAREICKQIELLFTELAQLGDEFTAEEAARIQRFVEDRNLLLRIQLVRKELAESEV
jgi:hypothetical protein